MENRKWEIVNSRVIELLSQKKGDNLTDPGRPESFNVLVKELQGLGLDVKVE